MAKELSFVVSDPVGLHARPATILVNQASKFTSNIKLVYNDKEVNLKSIMGVMSLGVPTKATVTIVAEGDDEEDVVASIAKVIKEQKVAEIKAKLMNGTLNVFDTATFTVNGKKLETYMANVNFEDDGTGKDNLKADTQVIENGVFFESKHRSAPYFDVRIDGITLLNEKY